MISLPIGLEVFVAGKPETQGSMRAYPGRNGGAFLVQGGSQKHRERLEDWRQSIRSTVALELSADYELHEGPLEVVAAFGMQRPAYHPKKQRTWPISARSGDIDKLARAVLDALTGVVWVDDSQVLSMTVSKDWSTRPGLTLRIRPAQGAEAAQGRKARPVAKHPGAIPSAAEAEAAWAATRDAADAV